MQISVTFRQLESSDALKNYVTERLKKLKRYLEGPLEAHVVLGLEKFRHQADVTINSNGHIIKAHEENTDMYAAIDLVMDKIDMQLRRRREKMREAKTDRIRNLPPASAAAEEEQPLPPIRRLRLEAPRLDLADALTLIQKKGADLLPFVETSTGTLCILHRRADGGYTLVEPEMD
jgi:putative sigma-54 modulation protein